MTATDLKTKLHKLIDQSKNQDLLSTIHDVLEIRKDSKPGEMWKSLTKDEKKELLEAEKESRIPSNLVTHEEVMKKYQKWL